MIATTSDSGMVGPWAAGTLMSPREFDRTVFERGFRYELVNGVLVVSPTQPAGERDANEELGSWLRNHHENRSQNSLLDTTLPEHTIRTGVNRRVADRAIWVGLGRLPKRTDVPSIIAEFVSEGRRSWLRDYETKRDEYESCGVLEYWVFDRFERTLTVYKRHGGKFRKRVYREKSVYTTDLLPGFELRLAELFKLAERWSAEE